MTRFNCPRCGAACSAPEGATEIACRRCGLELVAPGRLHVQRIAVLGAAGIGAVACFLPWLTADAGRVPGVLLGGGAGWFSLLFFAGAIALALTHDRPHAMGHAVSAGATAAAVSAAALAVIAVFQAECLPGVQDVAAGVGVYLAGTAAAAVTVLAWLPWRRMAV